MTDEMPSRPGSSQDLARRMDRMEQKHEELAKEVTALTATMGQVVLNQKHAEDINELRFTALGTAIGQVGSDLKAFMSRIEGIIVGDVDTAQGRQGRELVAEYQRWRTETESRLDSVETFATQGRFLGRVIVVILGGQALALVAAIAALLK